MTIARSTAAIIGTSETVGVTLANNTTQTSSETDLLGNNTSKAEMFLTEAFTSTVTAGTVDTAYYESRVSGSPAASDAPLVASVTPINGTLTLSPEVMGKSSPGRFVTVTVKNNATGASLTNLFVGYELYVYS